MTPHITLSPTEETHLKQDTLGVTCKQFPNTIGQFTIDLCRDNEVVSYCRQEGPNRICISAEKDKQKPLEPWNLSGFAIFQRDTDSVVQEFSLGTLSTIDLADDEIVDTTQRVVSLYNDQDIINGIVKRLRESVQRMDRIQERVEPRP